MLERTTEQAKQNQQESPASARTSDVQAEPSPVGSMLELQRTAGNDAVQRALRSGFQGTGSPLPHFAAIQAAFGPHHDLSSVHAHVGGPAAEAATAVNASAFATGDRVAFKEPPSVGLAAHEAAHSIQQRAGVNLPGGISRRGDPYEQQASLIGARVAEGKPVGHLLPQSNGSAPHRPVIQRQDDAGAPAAPGGAPQNAAAQSYYQQVKDALQKPDPVAGVGDPHQAFMILNGLNMADMLQTLDLLSASGDLQYLVANIASASDLDVPRLQTAMSAVSLAHGGEGVVVRTVVVFVSGMQNLPPDQQNDILNYVLHVKGKNIDRESLIALATAKPATNEQATTPPGAMSPGNTPLASAAGGMGATAMAGGGKPRGPGVPKRPQPPQLRVGNLAHRLIAGYYVAAHPGDITYTNSVPMISLVRAWGAMHGTTPDESKLGGERLKRPDITNFTRTHLYEIKPELLAGVAAAEAAYYISLFARLGIVIMPGPPGEPGTSGIIEIPPIGFFRFEAPSPGVILYGLKVRLKSQTAQKGQEITTAETVGLVILAVGIVAAAVLLALIPGGIIVDEVLLDAAIAASATEAPGAVAGTAIVAGGIETGVAATPEILELEQLIDLEFAGEAANDNALVDVVLDEAAGF
jgi:hypothetical protein